MCNDHLEQAAVAVEATEATTTDVTPTTYTLRQLADLTRLSERRVRALLAAAGCKPLRYEPLEHNFLLAIWGKDALKCLQERRSRGRPKKIKKSK